jgi:GYF domain 2
MHAVRLGKVDERFDVGAPLADDELVRHGGRISRGNAAAAAPEEQSIMSQASTIAGFAALLALAPTLAVAQPPARVEPLRLAQLAPPPLPQPAAAQFFYAENGKPVGPLTLAEIQAKIAAGAITPDTLVWKAGAPAWVAAKQLPEVAPLFAGGPAPKPAPTPAPAPAPAPTPAPAAAAGCTGKVLLSDDFRQVDDSWGVVSDAVSVEDGKVKVKVDPNGHYGFGYNGQSFDDADYCVTVQSPNNAKDINDSNLLAGMLFWAEDGANTYAVFVEPIGAAAVGRAVKGQWTTPVPFRLFEGVNKGPGAKNNLHISTSGSSIIVYINGQKFASLRGQLPQGGGKVGFWAQSEKSIRDSWKFLNLKVTEHAQ